MSDEYKKLSEEIWGAIILDIEWAKSSNQYKEHEKCKSQRL
jgi:hypothetical protein